MNEIIRKIEKPDQITAAAHELRRVLGAKEITPSETLNIFERWADALGRVDQSAIAGVTFLRLWLRRNTLEPVIERELGRGALHGNWTEDGRTELKAYPVGIVGHWPAGNIDIQPVLSMTCALLGGNACLVRIPRDLEEQTRRLIAALVEVDTNSVLSSRVRLLVFGHEHDDLQRAMAESVDGAMIWGGEEAVAQVRSLPFPHWARIAVFGPRTSVAAVDASSWSDVEGRESLCRRIARDVWQFDQQACSSPQVLFVEKQNGDSTSPFIQALRAAFDAENRVHPREKMEASTAPAICRARAACLTADETHNAVFSSGPDWTIQDGAGTQMPEPTQGRTLAVLQVPDLVEAVATLDSSVQTLGLAVADAGREAVIASIAASRGVDRVVPLGRMHVFAPPWDGMDLIRTMVRMVRHVRS